MRWESLFEDLETQLNGELLRDRATEIQEMVRIERSQVGLADRLRAQYGNVLALDLAGGLRLRGTLRHVGAGWLSMAEGPAECVVPFAALRGIEGMDGKALPADVAALGPARRRLGLGAALRALVRDRTRVALHGTDGRLLGAGTLDHAGADYLQLAVHPRDEYRRPGAVHAVVAVPFAALAAVRRDT
ncbi:hypothetical protein NCCP1664_28500 [Zafaria cholistanensis]|uniref:Uncharacterized protein n=1 Tax=Zafaria cholistanensis TaxID=1682741 RepID=A0A5A7NU13_9MICC|nr:hypothetical protein [Zafaria cholistanensis]GER24355.1 hypothetical protein NCCP1664_28500 [Zafaria cholistanensis]